jgi:hypothetical protein
MSSWYRGNQVVEDYPRVGLRPSRHQARQHSYEPQAHKDKRKRNIVC